MLFHKNNSEGRELWIISLDFRNGLELEEFVETSEENALEKIKDIIEEKEKDPQIIGSQIIDYISVAKVEVVEVKYPTTKTTIELK